MNAPSSIAFYLPQYYPIPENSLWWEPGFTEWTNVTKAKRLFRGHEQPFLPSELGFYDLRCAEVRSQQAQLAAEYGVSAFCYWHYWFAGRRLLERPMNEVLILNEPDHPFCIAWANQTWSGTWHGAPDRILVEQTYPGDEDDLAHFDYLYNVFSDRRYFKVDGKPLLYIFRPEGLPNAIAWSDKLRSYLINRGLKGVFLVGEISDLLGNGPLASNAIEYGFDAMVYMRFPADNSPMNRFMMRLRRKLLKHPETYPTSASLHTWPADIDSSTTYPCVYTNWDNTPRSGNRGLVVKGSTPGVFGRHLSQALSKTIQNQPANPLVFIKSWNEWAEGNVMEPSRKFGRGFLEAHRYAMQTIIK